MISIFCPYYENKQLFLDELANLPVGLCQKFELDK